MNKLQAYICEIKLGKHSAKSKVRHKKEVLCTKLLPERLNFCSCWGRY